jgi:hypothetical protein
MGKRNKEVKDLGMTAQEAIQKGILGQCYHVLGKYYTSETFHTAPPVQFGQCPSCAEFTWDEHPTEDFGSCSSCGFSG